MESHSSSSNKNHQKVVSGISKEDKKLAEGCEAGKGNIHQFETVEMNFGVKKNKEFVPEDAHHDTGVLRNPNATVVDSPTTCKEKVESSVTVLSPVPSSTEVKLLDSHDEERSYKLQANEKADADIDVVESSTKQNKPIVTSGTGAAQDFPLQKLGQRTQERIQEAYHASGDPTTAIQNSFEEPASKEEGKVYNRCPKVIEQTSCSQQEQAASSGFTSYLHYGFTSPIMANNRDEGPQEEVNLNLVFNLYVKKAKQVTATLRLGDNYREIMLNQDQERPNHWKSKTLSVPADQPITYTYSVQFHIGFLRALWAYNGPVTELCDRCASSGVNQYDIFHYWDDKHYVQQRFEGHLYYLDIMYDYVNKISLKDTLMECNNIGFDNNSLPEFERREFVKWLTKCARASLTPYQALFLVVLLGRVARQFKSVPIKYIPQDVADTLLRRITEFTASSLPSDSDKFVEEASIVLIPVDSPLGWLSLLVHFYRLIELPCLLQRVKKICTGIPHNNIDDDFVSLAQRLLAEMASHNCPDKKAREEVVKVLICRAPSIKSLLNLNQMSSQMCLSPQEKDILFTEAFWAHLEGITSTSDEFLVLAGEWETLSKGLRHKISNMITNTILEKLDGSPSWWNKERVEKLNQLVLKDEIYSTKEMLHLVETLANAENYELCVLFRQLLNCPELTEWWNSVPTETLERMCQMWLQRRFVKKRRLMWLSQDSPVVQILNNLGMLCETVYVSRHKNLKDVLGSYILHRLHECDLKEILGAFDQVGKMSDVAQRCYTKSINDVLHGGKDDVMSRIEEVLCAFRGYTSKRPAILPFAEDILVSIMDVTKPSINDEEKVSNEDVVMSVLGYHDAWITFLGAKGSVTKLHAHSKFLRVRQALEWFSKIVVSHHIRITFIESLLQKMTFLSTGNSEEDALSQALAPLCGVASVIVKQRVSKWKTEIKMICDARRLYKDQLSRVSFLVRYCQSIMPGTGLHISNLHSWVDSIEGFVKTVGLKFVDEVEGHVSLQSLSRLAEIIFPLKFSSVFRVVSQCCLKREVAEKKAELSVEDVASILSTRAVQEFQEACSPLFDKHAEISVEQANIYWKQMKDKDTLNSELSFIEEYLKRGTVRQEKKEMLLRFLELPKLQKKVQVTMKLLKSFGLHESKDSKLLQSLELFRVSSQNTPLTLIELTENVSSVSVINDFLDTDDLINTVTELASSRDLISFFQEVADEDIRVLIEAVEEHSDQFISESTVSDLIEVHRFLGSLLKSKATDPEKLLENLKSSYDELGKASGMAARISSCAINVHSLRGLYMNMTNRGDMTKEIIANAVERGTYELDVKPDCSQKAAMTYIQTNGKIAVYSLPELYGLRSRALLIVSSDKKPAENPGTKLVDFGTFVEQIDTITEILSTVSKLQSSGNPKFRTFWKTLDSMPKTKELGKKLQKELNSWEDILKTTRNAFFYLKFFHSDQMWKVQNYFTAGNQQENKDEVKREVHSLLRYIDPTVKIEEIDSMRNCFKKPKSEEDLEANLCSLGTFLDSIFQSRNTAHRDHEKKVSAASAKQIKETVKPGQLYVAVLEPNSTMTVNVVMSLFRNVTDGPPKPNQILFCHPETAWEEVLLFLQRCFEAPNFGLPSKLHCLANVENLDNEMQFDLVEEIKKFQEQSLRNNESSFLLSLICCGGDHHHIVDQFLEFKHHVPGLTDVELKNYFAASFPNVSMVTSDLPGSGKTERIREDAAAIRRGIVTVPISGPVSRQALVKQLCNLKLRAFESLHLDVGEVNNTQFLDVFLFQLVVVGMVSSRTTFYHLPTIYISIEIANTLQHWLRDSFPVCKCFKRVHLDQDCYKKLKVSKEITSSVQVVCQYLDAYEHGTLEHKDLMFSGSDQLKPLPHVRCQQLLSKHFSATGDMSFTVLEIFLNVLADQLMKFSTSQYFRTTNLKVMLKGDHDVRTQLFRSLLEVSQEFAARSVLVCRTEQSEAVAEKQASEILERMRSQVGNTAEQMVDRVKGMIQWADSNHLMVVFNSLDSHTISALYRKVSEVPKRVQDLFKSQASGKKLDDFASLTQQQLQEKLNRIVRSLPPPKNHDLATLSYALTPDNVLKMSLIIQRVRANIPVIVMGETGCGKTSLIRYLAKTCEVPFHVFNFHAGIEEEDIFNFINELMEEAQKDGLSRWVFLDEINTCEHLGIINDLICHRSLRGKPLPPNLVLMAACNPYRLRPSEQIETAGLSGKLTVDEYSKLVYRVHPLPETMIDYVWDYGSLDATDEQAYIARMVEALFDNQYQSLLVSLLTASQAFIRQAEKSPYCVSLRDVNRCKLLIDWFYHILKIRPPLDLNKIEHHLKNYHSITQKFDKKSRSIILALAHCYQSRLPTTKSRKDYRKKITSIFQAKGGIALKGGDFEAIVRMEQEDYLARMELPEGTAKNAALRENVFVILVCILNHIPIFVVGKPGCSKSLSMQVIRSNLRGHYSVDEFFKILPQLYFVSHQGSESSTSQGIIKVFEKARKYTEKTEEGAVLPVVLLDEIGLAEISKYNPLKVLHSLLEPSEGKFPDVAVVGISNWSLDAAKMNRAIHLSRPEPDVEDLKETGLSIRHASSKSGREDNVEDLTSKFAFPDDDQLECLAKVYFEHQGNQKYANFHGLRDYYSLVKSLSVQRNFRLVEFMSDETSSRLIQTSLQRNFGGLRQEESNIERVFMEKMPRCSVIQQPVATADLIAENLHDRLARHLMLITVADSAIGLLDKTLRELDKETKTIFGSRFEEDQSDDYNYRILSRIILCMERDCVLILRDLENIYGSLYDMLNQNYIVVGGKKNCRVALGAYSNPMCQVHDGFRCIVLVDQQKVDYTDPPFLNRFEKQLLRFSDVITTDEKNVISTLRTWVEDVSAVSHLKAKFSVTDTFSGFYEDTLPSLVLRHRSKKTLSEEELLRRCKKDLLWVASPDGILRALKSKLAEERMPEVKQLCEEYFRKPIHNGIGNYIKYELEQDLNTVTADGLKLLVMTHSNIHTDVCKLLEGVVKCQAEKLSSFKSEKHLTARIKSFWIEPEVEMLVIQCAPSLDAPHMLLMKSIVEHQWNEFLSSAGKEERKRKKHVCILIHMQRENQEENKMQHWQFNFLSGWKQVMIDVLKEPSFSVTKILGTSVVDILNSDVLPFKKIAIDQMLWCFTCIKYTSGQRSLEDVVQLVKKISSSEEIFVTFKELVEKWIKNHQADGDATLMTIAKPWQIAVACDRQALINSSTLVGAMQHHVSHLVRQPLAMIVFFLEKESTWPRCVTSCEVDNQDELIEWRNILLDKEMFNMEEIAEPRGAEFYEVTGQRRLLMFPFSNIIKKKIEEVKTMFMEDLQQLQLDEDNLNENGELKDIVVSQQIDRFSFIVEQKAPQLFQSKFLLKNIASYVEDILDITSAEIAPELTRTKRVQLLKSECASSMAKSFERDALILVTEIHSLLWTKATLCAAELDLVKAGHLLTTVDFEVLFQNYVAKFDNITQALVNVSNGTHGELSKQKQDDEAEGNETSDEFLQEVIDEQQKKQKQANTDVPEGKMREQISNDKESKDEDKQNSGNQAQNPVESSNEGTNGFADVEQKVTGKKSETSFAEALVDATITALLPTQQTVTAFSEPAQWQRSANSILSLATRLLVDRPVFHFLRVCNDFASIILLPESLEPYSLYFFGNLGKEHAPEFLNSEKCFKEVDEFVSSLEVSSSERIQHFLSLFYGRCIATNPNTQLMYGICQSICSHREPEGVKYMGSVIHRVLLTEEGFDPDIFSKILESPENLKDHPALMDIDTCLFNNENGDSHFPVLCCDLLCEVAFQNVDTANIRGSEDEEMKQFNRAVYVLCNEENRNGLRMICAVAFLRSFLKSLATAVVQDQSQGKLAMLLKEVNALLQLQAGSTSIVKSWKSSARMYLLKEFRRKLSLYNLRKLCENTQQLTFLHDLKWCDSVSMYKTQQYFLCDTGKLSSGRDGIVSLMENQETGAMADFVTSAENSIDNKLKLIALITESFYHVQSLRPTKDTEDQAAKKISKLVCARFSKPFSELVKQLLGEKDFQAPELQMHPESPSIEVQRAALVIHLAALVVSNAKQSGSRDNLTEPLALYMLNPTKACETFVLVAPTSDVGYDVYRNFSTYANPLHLCSCITAFVCAVTSGNPRCPNCKSPSKPADRESKKAVLTNPVKGYLAFNPEHLKSSTITARSLKPVMFRALHLLVHAALYAGSALGLVNDKELLVFLNGKENLKEPQRYCFSHFRNDLVVLGKILACSEEQVITWMHTVLQETGHLFTGTNVQGLCKTEEQRNTLELKYSKEIQPSLSEVVHACPSHQATSDAQSGIDDFIEIQVDEEDAVLHGLQKDERQRSENLRRLFRITIPKSYEHLKATFLNTEDKERAQYPIIGLFLDHSSDLSLLCHLNSLLRWHRVVESMLSRRLNRQDAKSKCITEFVSGNYKGKDSAERKKLFEAFKESWNEVRGVISKYLQMEEKYVPRLNEMSKIGYCLVEECDLGIYLAAALKALQEIQNEFLEKVLNIAASGRCSALSSIQRGEGESAVGVVHLQDARERELIQYEWTDDILRHCQNNTEYGHGREIIYDFDKIEKELVARFLLGKTYLATDNGLKEFVFSQELFHACAGILNDLQQSIPQVPLTADIQDGILRLKESNLKNVQDLLEHLEVVVCLLKRTKGNPDQILTEYTDKWLSMLPCPFPKSLLQECCDSIMLKHVVALYQALEDFLSEAAVDSVPDKYREVLIDEAKKVQIR